MRVSGAGSLSLPRVCARVALRPLRASDLRRFQSYRHDPQVGRYQGWSPMPDAEAEQFLKGMTFRPGEWYQLGIADRETDILLGDIGLFVRTPLDDAEIGFTMSREAQGRGLATEAVGEALRMLFEIGTLQRIGAVSDSRNEASIRLLQRVGMSWTGALQSICRGEACVEYVYEILRP